MSDILTFLDEFPDLETFSTGDIQITDDSGAYCPEIHQKQNQYRLTNLEIAPKTPSMFESLVSRMPRLTDLSIHSIGTINLLPSAQQYCPNLTSLMLDMYDHYYPTNNDPSLDQKKKYKDWILLFQALPKLEQFRGISVPMPMVVLEALAKSCPRLKLLKAYDDSTLTGPGVSFLLQNCLALKDLFLEQYYYADLFKGNQPWKAPLENLHFDAVILRSDEENDLFGNGCVNYRSSNHSRLNMLLI
ncbi:hypothetical protein BGX26_013012 [Mortierella sp. AD094]|nr:hypothetical protein BGX26_013012 [Mortierella sp. AD094]